MAREIGEEESLVFGSHLMVLAGPVLKERIE